jgi:hypothetical protein
VFGSASAPPSGLRSSRTKHPQHQRPRGWAKTNRRSGPNQVAKVTEHSAPISSVTAPTGNPPSRTVSIAAIPVDTTSRIVLAAGVRAEGIRSAREASICERRAAAKLIVFALYSPNRARLSNILCHGNCA